MSSAAEEEADKDVVCANCGIVGVDEIKLQECHDCDLEKYCSDKCKDMHRDQHKEECKKRADELHDKRLFTQPDGTNMGECPICFLPMPLQNGKSTFMSCCSKLICRGCCYAHLKSNKHDEVKASKCLFCRASASNTQEYRKREKERIEANDPGALNNKGNECYKEGDYDKALKYWTNAAELGNAQAHYRLGYMYEKGEIVEKDAEKAVSHYENAAIDGHPYALETILHVSRRTMATSKEP
jgi:tetratricopeptide (TPR) repeat protein